VGEVYLIVAYSRQVLQADRAHPAVIHADELGDGLLLRDTEDGKGCKKIANILAIHVFFSYFWRIY
jgi:hypothetical protein